MKILSLSIRQKFFDEIVSGEKQTETREIRPTNGKKYFKYNVGGKLYDADEELPEDGDLELVPIKYDAIKFLTGEYKGKRPFVIVEVKEAKIELLTDENGEDITYDFEGEEYVAAQIVYSLGKIIEV